MKWMCRWRNDSRQGVPPRVVIYNVVYLIYAMLVLRMGLKSVFPLEGIPTCASTAPELYFVSTVFVSLSLAAFPNADTASPSGGTTNIGGSRISGIVGNVFPNAYSNPAPPDTIEKLRVVLLEEIPDSYPKECCVCMMEYVAGEVTIVTPCEHIFHKRCCNDWLQLSRTCPVCRADIPGALGMNDESTREGTDSISQAERGYSQNNTREDRRLEQREFPREISNLVHYLRRDRLRSSANDTSSDHGVAVIEIPESVDDANEPTATERGTVEQNV
jgi:hypothetical protein